ncbi:NAD-dependent epimerase/dehydratase family protein [Paenibacillus cremeus]|uniref:NAD(P)-dependent oxidoreductase n=1 Tax=Paenibacillus cremeus TaxID=2163881 RepID=A0A559K9T2_9BACL|nr:NAD(P)-dependent oxidoreductase [Paenibacillus cremeus]TVY08890.1 NAD(P)-dependent oxidoreductase [Paenibacillus cremeus]
MKVAVTGANGRVGRYMIQELLDHGYEVRAVTMEPWEESPVEQAQADVKDAQQVFQALSGCDAVIHLAAIPSPHGYSESHIFQNNTMGVFHVLHAAGELGMKRAAVASSDCAFGITFSFQETKPVYLPMDELHPVAPDNCYGMSKVVGEQIAEGMAKRYGMTIASLRITHVLEPKDYSSGWLTKIIDNPEAEPWNVWSYLDVRDCVRAFRLSIEKPFSGHEVFCIASSEQRTAIPSKELASRFYPDAELRQPFTGRESFLNCTKAKTMLGFEAQYLISHTASDTKEEQE